MSRSYINGNYVMSSRKHNFVRYRETLRSGEPFLPDFPDSIDLKITNKCSIGCPFCHESSRGNGRSFNLSKTMQLLDTLPDNVNIEIAIGGGDVLEIPDETIALIKHLKRKGYNTAITVSIESLKKYYNTDSYDFSADTSVYKLLQEVDSIGISVNHYLTEDEDALVFSLPSTRNIVYHVILGIISPKDLRSFLGLSTTMLLVLGYKSWGRGRNSNPLTPELIKEYSTELKGLYNNLRYQRLFEGCTVGFDNLAIEQLHLKEWFTSEQWDTLYFGNDFTHSMYIDAVNEEFSPTSYSSERVKWSEWNNNVVDYFRENHK